MVVAATFVPGLSGASADEPIHMSSTFRGVAGGAQHFMLPMRDNVRLWTSVYFPKNMPATAPTILLRTPYAFGGESRRAKPLLERGYVIVLQNERGRYWSEGEYHIVAGAGPDGYDTIDWISKQPWSNKRVGTLGCSSSGDNQLPLLAQRHPAHAAAITMASGSVIGKMGAFDEHGAFYRGGAVFMPWLTWYLAMGQRDFPKFPPGISDENRDWLAEYAMKHDWMAPRLEDFLSQNTANAELYLPLQDALRQHGAQRGLDFDVFVRRQPNDPAWKTLPLFREGDIIDTPTLWVFQNHDLALGPNLAAFEYVISKGSTPRVRDDQHLLISALGHCTTMTEPENTIDGDRPIGDARVPNRDMFIDWFDHWLRGAENNVPKWPRAQVYVPGKNSWQSFSSWPAATSQRTFYLHSEKGAGSRLGDGQLLDVAPSSIAIDSLVYDPRTPVPTIGGDACCLADVNGSKVQPGSYDQAALELRRDILVYTSPELKVPLDVVGFVEVELYVSSDAPDTDFTANLVDVASDGTAYILAGSIQRARWREGYSQPRFMKPGEVYKLKVGPFYIANRFEAGHRVRLDVSSSNFPRYDRNLNTGGNNFDESRGRVARNSVHHGPVQRSVLRLPIVSLQ